MKKQAEEEIKYRIEEINRLLEYYNPYEKYIRYAMYIAGTIGFIVLCLTITYWAMLIYLVIVLGSVAIARGKKTNELSESDIKKTINNHIRFIIATVREEERPELPKQRIYGYSLGEIEQKFLTLDRSASMYDAFVKRYPDMDTPKLRSIAAPKKKIF